MKRVVCLMIALMVALLFTLPASAEGDDYCHHMCHHECGHCKVDLLNEDPDSLTGEEAALLEKMNARPMAFHYDAKYLGIAVRDADVFFEPNGVKVGYIKEKADVFVIETGKYWYKIVYENEYYAYVRSNAVELYDANLPWGGQLYRVSSTGGNRHALLRECPCGDSAIVARLSVGDYVKVVEFYDNHWALVMYDMDGCEAYIRTECIQVSHRFDK